MDCVAIAGSHEKRTYQDVPANEGVLSASSSDDALIVRVLGLTGISKAVSTSLVVSRSLWIRIGTEDEYRFNSDGILLNDNLTINALADLSNIENEEIIFIDFFSWDPVFFWYRIGRVTISLGDLIRRPKISLLLSEDNADFLLNKPSFIPTELHITVERCPLTYPPPQPSPYADASINRTRYPKHVLMLTRGTRGDVQPFVALARGLAQSMGWMVTICTELRYKSFIQEYAHNIGQGAIRFRPSGGDTHARIDTPIARWAMANKSAVLQGVMLARSEMEFFSSEPIMFWWATQLRPDALIYSFTMASVAMILSEKLAIPMVGFILQPTIIPSSQYPPVVPLRRSALPAITNRIEKSIAVHGVVSALKSIMDNGLFSQALNTMRIRHGLRPFSANSRSTWRQIIDCDSPLVIPINELAFGGRPDDWSPSIQLTDFIFLNSATGSQPPELNTEVSKFISQARLASDPVIAISFSSMPVPRNKIAKIVIRIATQCRRRPRVIALVGDKIIDPLSTSTANTYMELQRMDRVLEIRGAPFGALFAKIDCVIIHGGLGTTAEAMRAGIPVICTGVLLMDQRFWGQRCASIGIAPEMTHISSFASVCVDQVDRSLEPSNGMADAALQFAHQIRPQPGTSTDGIRVNVDAIVEKLIDAKPFDTRLTRRTSNSLSSFFTGGESSSASSLSIVAGTIRSYLFKVGHEDIDIEEQDDVPSHMFDDRKLSELSPFPPWTSSPKSVSQ